MLLGILSSPRAGSHLLRGMINADPLVEDVGSLTPTELNVPAPDNASYETMTTYLSGLEDNYPGKDVMIGFKYGLMFGNAFTEAIDALLDLDGRIILVTRDDLLAQVASLALAVSTGAFHTSAPVGSTVQLNVPMMQREMGTLGRDNADMRARLSGDAHVELTYEKLLTQGYVAGAVSGLLGRNITIGPPTTPKSAPALADYVTNLDAFGRTS